MLKNFSSFLNLLFNDSAFLRAGLYWKRFSIASSSINSASGFSRLSLGSSSIKREVWSANQNSLALIASTHSLSRRGTVLAFSLIFPFCNSRDLKYHLREFFHEEFLPLSIRSARSIALLASSYFFMPASARALLRYVHANDSFCLSIERSRSATAPSKMLILLSK